MATPPTTVRIQTSAPSIAPSEVAPERTASPAPAQATPQTAPAAADSLETPEESRSRTGFKAHLQQSGKNPTVQNIDIPSRSQSRGRPGSTQQSPASTLGAPPTGDGAEVLTSKAPQKRTTSSISGLQNKNGVLSFLLHMPPAKPGQPEQCFRVSVLGGQHADLTAIVEAQIAAHLAQAIALVQSDPKSAGFSAITFEGRLNDEALAKAVVHKGSTSFVLGGNQRDKVAGSEKIFSDELEALLVELQKTLGARNGQSFKVEPHVLRADEGTTAPPATPATPLTSALPPTPSTDTDTDTDNDNPWGISESDPEGQEGLYGPPRSQVSRAAPTPKTQPAVTDEDPAKSGPVDDDDDADDVYVDAPESFSKD